MSQKQLKQLSVITDFINGHITRVDAASKLGLSPRQITRKKNEVLRSGPEALLHKNTGRKPAHALNGEIKEKVITIFKKPEHNGVNFLHFTEILSEQYGIELSYSSVYSILTNEGFKSPKKNRHISGKKSRRARKKHPGELLQIDATPYDWFGTGIKYALHGAIDDTEGKLTGLYMTQNECLFGYFEVMRQCIMKHGCPQTIYSDKHTIFRSPKADALTTEDILSGKRVPLTQFGRAMDELACDIIWANSPQAKGRIERVWDTLQSRLPVDLAIAGIKSVKEANEFFQDQYIDKFNSRFAIESGEDSMYVPLSESIDIDTILCTRNTRKTDNAGVFSFKNKSLRIVPEGYPVVPAKKEVEVLVSPRIGICAKYGDHIYQTIRYVPPLRKPAHKPKKQNPKILSEVDTHLKYGSEEWKKIWHYESYGESLKLLYDIFFRPQQASSC